MGSRVTGPQLGNDLSCSIRFSTEFRNRSPKPGSHDSR